MWETCSWYLVTWWAKENILLEPSVRAVKLADFGSAKVRNETPHKHWIHLDTSWNMLKLFLSHLQHSYSLWCDLVWSGMCLLNLDVKWCKHSIRRQLDWTNMTRDTSYQNHIHGTPRDSSCHCMESLHWAMFAVFTPEVLTDEPSCSGLDRICQSNPIISNLSSDFLICWDMLRCFGLADG